MLNANCFPIHTCAQPQAEELQAPVSPLLPFLLVKPPASSRCFPVLGAWDRGPSSNLGSGGCCGGAAAVALAPVDGVMPQGIGFLEAKPVSTDLSSRMQGEW